MTKVTASQRCKLFETQCIKHCLYGRVAAAAARRRWAFERARRCSAIQGRERPSEWPFDGEEAAPRRDDVQKQAGGHLRVGARLLFDRRPTSNGGRRRDGRADVMLLRVGTKLWDKVEAGRWDTRSILLFTLLTAACCSDRHHSWNYAFLQTRTVACLWDVGTITIENRWCMRLWVTRCLNEDVVDNFKLIVMFRDILPRDAMLARYICCRHVSVLLSVRPSVCYKSEFYQNC